jgi:predicted nucleic acid-binding protein
MQAIVADTSPLNYLILIEAEEVLPQVFSSILIPTAVRQELSHRNAPAKVRNWIANSPPWLQVVSLTQLLVPSLSHLDAGEREAISLALRRPATLLLMDDRDGAIEARRRGVDVIGTLAVLDMAASRGMIDLREMFRRLQLTSFRSPLRLMARMLEQDALRKK